MSASAGRPPRFALAWAKSPTVHGTGQYGWVEEVAPTLADGLDGKGYFRESDGITTPAVDWRYLHLHTGVLARRYLATGKAELPADGEHMALGKLMDHVSTTTWLVDLTGGSRIPAGSDPFVTAAMFVAAWVGGTTAWDCYLAGVVGNIDTIFRTTINQRGPNYMRDSSKLLATIVRAGS